MTLDRQDGFAVPAALILLLLMATISAAVAVMVNTETQLSYQDSESSRAYYAAEAGMEKMVADLDELFATSQSPTASQIEALAATSPDLSHVTFDQYDFNVPNTDGVLDSETRNISSGPNEGLIAEIIPIELNVVAKQTSGAEVRMIRNVEVALIPVFQFGIFSDTDLSYHPGPGFDFAGRVHTNGNLFLAASSSGGLKFHSKVSAVGEVIRAEMMNGLGTQDTGRTGSVKIPTAPNGCDGSAPACRALDLDEGSRVGGPSSSANSIWDNLSQSTYNGMIVNGETGAKELELPFVDDQLRPIEIVRRPPASEDSSSLVSQSRLYSQAQIRILLSDSADDLPGGSADPENVQLANLDDYENGVAVNGVGNTFFGEADTDVDSDWLAPYGGGTDWPLIGGFLRVEAMRAGGGRSPVTREWLSLGFARGLATPGGATANTVHPDSILILQTQADRNMDGNLNDAGETTAIVGESSRTAWFPINLYDSREGEVRDSSLGSSNTTCAIGGVFNIVELDVGNLKRWLAGTIGENGAQTDYLSQNGYLLYFSDRRGMRANGSGVITGAWGFEDVVNPASSSGAPDGQMDEGEDVDENNQLATYGKSNLGDGFLSAAQGADTALDSPVTRISCPTNGRKNRVSGARRALKLINGQAGNVPERPDGTGGFTVGSENPVYVRGHYNADSAGFGSGAAAAIISDAVTLLSENWEDWQSMRHPSYLGSSTTRSATTTWYRMAVAAGKPLPWEHPTWSSNQHYGLDGGTHNFLRFLERWTGRTAHYRGSMVSLFTSEYANGIFKYPNVVYRAPSRDYSFDTNFLTPSQLPPATPRFRDVVNLGFQHVLEADDYQDAINSAQGGIIEEEPPE